MSDLNIPIDQTYFRRMVGLAESADPKHSDPKHSGAAPHAKPESGKEEEEEEPTTKEEAYAALAKLAESTYETLLSYPGQIAESEAESNIAAKLTEAFDTLIESGIEVSEAFKRIRRMVAGTLRRAKIKILRGSAKMKGKQYRRRNRAKIRLMGKRYRRKAVTKRKMRRRKMLQKRMGESEQPGGLDRLLSEAVAAVESDSGSGEDYTLIETVATNALATATILADFFEELSDDEKAESYVEALDTLADVIEAAEAKVKAGTMTVDQFAEAAGKWASVIQNIGEAFDGHDFEAPVAGN